MTNTEKPGHKPPFIPLIRRLMFVPGSNQLFRLRLRRIWFVHSKMGFGGCFEDRSLIKGEFYDDIIHPLVQHRGRMAGHIHFLRGWNWSLLDQMAEVHQQIRIPVRFIWGVEDETFPLEQARAMADQFPNNHGIKEVFGARLFVHEERPEEVARDVIGFVNKS